MTVDKPEIMEGPGFDSIWSTNDIPLVWQTMNEDYWQYSHAQPCTVASSPARDASRLLSGDCSPTGASTLDDHTGHPSLEDKQIETTESAVTSARSRRKAQNRAA